MDQTRPQERLLSNTRGGGAPTHREHLESAQRALASESTYGRTPAQIFLRGALSEAAADRQNARLQAVLDVLVSLEEIDAAPADPERVTPEALARMQRSIDTLRGYVRRVDLFKEHAGAAFL